MDDEELEEVDDDRDYDRMRDMQIEEEFKEQEEANKLKAAVETDGEGK